MGDPHGASYDGKLSLEFGISFCKIHSVQYTTQIGELADLAVSQHFRQEFEDLLYTHRVNLMLVWTYVSPHPN